MKAIDIDPDLLQRSAEAALHAGEQSTVHIESEYLHDLPNLMHTLVPEGPYAYIVLAQVQEDGNVTLPIATTRQAIHDAYEILHDQTQLLKFWPLVELRSEWYVFHEGIAKVLDKNTGTIAEGGETIALFPVTKATGITGELVWSRVPRSSLGSSSDGPRANLSRVERRRDVMEKQGAFFDALKGSDVDGMLAVLSDGVQSAVRDYLNDTGTVIGLDGKESHRSFYTSLFDKYDIQSVGLLRRVVQEWYGFAEVRITAEVRGGEHSGRTVAFHTAEFFVPANDGRFVVRIGHGTDPVRVS
jgi:hypothetical protein